ncbi:MAG TPA: rRNA maturation RNase YbeY [Puia sp.]|nr:rRNA maturation RNase YbeY [Puia sp.]
MSKNFSVQFHFPVRCTLNNREGLKKFILSIFKKEKKVLEELTIVFCGDEYLLSLNRQFLHHDYYTDILSFPLSGAKQPLIAEIYISVDRVRENAKVSADTFQKELHRVIFHGVLHFCGYRDKSGSDIRKMRAAEDKYLKAYL